MAESDEPNAGSEISAAESASPATPDAATPSRSDDELWDSLVQGEADEPKQAAAPPAEESSEGEPTEEEAKAVAEEGQEQEAVEEEKEPEPDRPLVEQPPPDWLLKAKDRLKGLPGVYSKISDDHWALEAYREQFGTATEASKYKELAPTIEDLEAHVQRSGTLDKVDAEWENEPEALIAGLVDASPKSAMRLMERLPDQLAARPDTKAFAVLQAQMIRHQVQKLDELAAQEGRDPDEADADRELAERIRQRYGIGKHAPAAARGQQIDPELAQLRREKAERLQTEQRTFLETANDEFSTKLERLGDAVLGPVWKRPNSAYTTAAQEQIRDEVLTEVSKMMLSNQILDQQVKTMIDSAQRKDGALRAEVVRLMGRRAEGYMKVVVPRVLKKWNTLLRGGNTQDLQRRAASSSRRDPGLGGHTAPVSRGGVASEKRISEMSPTEKAEFYRKYPTDEDIFRRHGV